MNTTNCFISGLMHRSIITEFRRCIHTSGDRVLFDSDNGLSIRRNDISFKLYTFLSKELDLMIIFAVNLKGRSFNTYASGPKCMSYSCWYPSRHWRYIFTCETTNHPSMFRFFITEVMKTNGACHFIAKMVAGYSPQNFTGVRPWY